MAKIQSKKFATKLIELCNKHPETQGTACVPKLKKVTGKRQQTISTWLTGKSTPEMPTIKLLARFFGVTTAELLDDDFEVREIHAPYTVEKFYTPKLIEWKDLRAWENDPERESIRLILRDDAMAFAGQYSCPKGMTITIDPNESADIGDIVLARVGDAYTIKKLDGDGISQMLVSRDPRFNPIALDENCEILGRAVKAEISWAM